MTRTAGALTVERVNWHHVLESTIGTAAALILVIGGRRIVGLVTYRALRATLKLRGRLR